MTDHRNRHRRACLGALLILAALLLAACGRSPEGENIPRMDRRDLVTDVDVVVRCSDASGLVRAGVQSPLGQLWNSPEMTAFRDGLGLEDLFGRALVEEFEGPNAERMRDIYMEQIRMLDGEFVLGLDFGEFERDPAVTLAAAMRAEDYRRSLELDTLLFELEDVRTITASEDFRGTPITTYMRQEEDGDRFLYQAFHEGTLLASEDRPWIERALIRLKETPAREPDGQPVLAVTGTARLMDRLEALIAEKAAEDVAPFDPQTMIHGLGIDTVGQVALEICLKEDCADVDFRVARRGEWNRGLMVLVPADPVPLDLRLAHVPRDVASYQVTGLDLNALWTQIPEILGRISPEFQMQFSMGVNAVGGLMDINLNEEVFGNLDRLAFTYTRLGDDGQELVYGFRVKDADAMARTLDKLFAEHSPVRAQMGDFYRRTDVQGHGVHMLQFPMPAGEGGAMTVSEVGLTVVDRALVIGQGGLLVDYVQAAVRPQGEPAFYADPMFKAMAARVPADACTYGVSDLAAYARFFMDGFRTAVEAMEGRLATADSDDARRAQTLGPLADILAGMDSGRLPAAESVAGYFGTSDGYSVIDAAGFRSTMTVYYPER